jgi:hypothetical protein
VSDPAEQNSSRVANIVALAKGAQTRSLSTIGSEELEEIGFLTMRLAGLEEMISLWCEALLIRPEFGGFLAANRPVFTKQFSEKLALLRMLIKAAGTLYDIQTGKMETSIVALKDVGEDRNTIIHGLLVDGNASVAAFRMRGRDIDATLSGLRALANRCQEGAVEATRNFAEFYRELIGKRSVLADFENGMERILQSWLKVHAATFTIRMDTVVLRKAQLDEIEARRKLGESKKRLAEAKKVLRNTRARERRKSF